MKIAIGTDQDNNRIITIKEIIFALGLLFVYLYGLTVGNALTKIETLSVFFITSIGVLLYLITKLIIKQKIKGE